jgi:hypothetical protein
MASNAIALDHLDQQTFGDHELRQELLALFLRQTERLLDLMQGAALPSSTEREDAFLALSQAFGRARPEIHGLLES